MLNHIHAKGYELIDLVDSAVNFVMTCKKGSNENMFIEFIVNTREIFIHTLINIYSYGYNIINEKIEKEKENDRYKMMKKKYEEYKELVCELKEKRNTFENESVKNLQSVEPFDDELTCIICYRQIADHRIKPCLHKGCKECLLTYMVDNIKCFMCRQLIQSIQKIPKEEIEELKAKKNKINKDNKTEDDKDENKKENETNNNFKKKEEENNHTGYESIDNFDENNDDYFL